ncbi:CHAT domain-containing protein [Streptomyces sp. NPDC001536]|uniref:CHAT domain-containing protein n=1 Tax=Streptomyces sp. NPDC001536 TaxID=3364583 RepID=UPI00367412BA
MPSHPRHAASPSATPTDAVLHIDNSEVSLRLPGRAGVVRQRAGVPDHAADQAWWVLRAWRTRSAAEAAAPLRPLDHAADTDPSHADLVAAGAALTRTYVEGPVGRALDDLLRHSPGPNAAHRLGLHVTDARLKDLPWEALCHPGTRSPLALDPHVALYRSASPGPGHGLESAGQDVPEGPLRTLALIAAPEEYGFARLDIETEQRRLLDATDRSGRLVLELLGEGTWQALRSTLHRAAFDIVHLSCHGYEQGLCLEDGTGAADLVPFDRLVAAFPDDAPKPGLLVLSACASARGASTGPFTPRTDLSAPGRPPLTGQLPGLAERFASAGFPAVLAMTAEVSDGYATDFGARLYERLAEDPVTPLPHTVARTRQELEQQRRPEPFGMPPDQPPRPRRPAEWGTPTLYAAGRPGGLRSEAATTARSPKPPYGAGGTAANAGAGSQVAVGRRRELQWLLRRLWQAGEPVQVTGLAGTGKTALVEESLARQAVPRQRVAHLDDRTSALETLTRMTRALTGLVDPQAAQRLCDPDLPDAERIRRAQEWFDAHEARDVNADGKDTRTSPRSAPAPAVVLFDFPTASAVSCPPEPQGEMSDCLKAAFLTAWVTSGDGGQRRLVVTSRSPVHFNLRSHAHPPLATLRVEPLPLSEARYLARRVPGLGVLRPQDLDRLVDGLGGHPRALAFAACLLRATPQAASPDIWPRLMDVLRARGLNVPEQHVQSVSAEGLSAVLREAAVLTAEDAALPAVWSRLCADARSALTAAAVFRGPMSAQAFLPRGESSADMTAARNSPPAPTRPAGPHILDELVAAGLLSSSPEPDAHPRFAVPRWIATYLSELAPQAWRAAHRRATAHWFARLGAGDLELPADVAAADEARYHAGQAGMADEFVGVTGLLCRRHLAAGRFNEVRALSREILTVVPPDSLLAADAHEGIGDCDLETGQVAAAVQAHERALAIRRRAGDKASIVQSLHRLGVTETNLSRYDRADAHFQEALSLSEQLGDHEEMSRIHHSLAVRADRHGDLAAKKRHLDRADALRGETANRRSLAARLTERGRLAIDEGRYADALRCFEQALEHDREVPADRHGIAETTLLVADVYLRLEQPDELKAHAREALLQTERIGDTDGMLRAYTYLVYAALMEKDVTTAHTLAEHHLALAERSGDVEDLELGLNLIAAVARDSGDLDTANRRWSECLASAERRGARDSEGRYRHHLGVVAYMDGDLEGARHLLAGAARTLKEAGADAGAAESLGALAHVLLTLAEHTGRPHLWDDSLRALADATLHLNQPDVQDAQLTRNRNVYAALVRRLGHQTTIARLHAFYDTSEAAAVLALLER